MRPDEIMADLAKVVAAGEVARLPTVMGPIAGGDDRPDEHAGEVAKQSRIGPLLLVATALLLLALPFALTAGKAFFLPIVTAIVIAVALSPLADAFGRLGIPNSLNAALAVVVFVAALALGVSLIVQRPAANLLASLPKTLQVIAGHVEQWRGDVRVITRRR